MYIKTEKTEIEWDEAKRQTNLEKHEIDFIDAAKLFAGRHYIIESKNPGNDKKRYIAVAEFGKGFVSVVFTMRHDAIRIISARKSRYEEKKAYSTIYH